MRGPDVSAWQGVLTEVGLLLPGDIDGAFGPKTEKATVNFELAHGLQPDGRVGSGCRNVIGAPLPPPTPSPHEVFDPRWKFLQAVGFTRVNAPRSVTLIPMHSMEAPERPDTAEGVASWFAGARGAPPKASAHVCGDEDSIVQCVLPNDIAWGAQGGNSISYHCEQAGYAEWPREKWLEPTSRSMIRLMASHVKLALAFFGLPAMALTEEEVASCVRDALIAQGKIRGALSGVRGGVCQHRQLTMVWQAWAKYGLPNPRHEPKPWWPSHVDCGVGYPIDVLMGDITSPTDPAPSGKIA
jgi:hypothetical protein